MPVRLATVFPESTELCPFSESLFESGILISHALASSLLHGSCGTLFFVYLSGQQYKLNKSQVNNIIICITGCWYITPATDIKTLLTFIVSEFISETTLTF